MLTSFFDVILTTAGAEVSTNSLMFSGSAACTGTTPRHAIKNVSPSKYFFNSIYLVPIYQCKREMILPLEDQSFRKS